MSVIELESLIGKTGLLVVESLSFPVVIIDAKRAWGNLRYKVKPIDGGTGPVSEARAKLLGSAWIDAKRVVIDRQELRL